MDTIEKIMLLKTNIRILVETPDFFDKFKNYYDARRFYQSFTDITRAKQLHNWKDIFHALTYQEKKIIKKHKKIFRKNINKMRAKLKREAKYVNVDI